MSKFLRRISSRYSKLGKRRKKKQVWRRPTGRDNKMRERRRGYPVRVQVGYKGKNQDREKINGKIPRLIKNIADFKLLQKNEVALIGNIGLKKKIQIAEHAKKEKIEIYNLNPKNFLEKIERKNKKKAMTEKSKEKNKKESKK